ncbi:RusA family crossover junction endodeoxyribonuclease [Marinoscillum pacificum]|uniref:RusA family crossover junction endodeoxyribonuclease n=1 Tax=Marinoscillum pacificum TaxID=392723 RepID=UPI0021582B99|nr:RusA family crossover junction endodeoxyribonuclease [Marinoscillum pacificum]
MGVKKPQLKEGESATFLMNPHWDEMLIFADIKVPTSQDFYKIIDKEEQLYKRIQKPNVLKFKTEISRRLMEKKKPWWPHKRKLSLSVNVGGPKNYIELKDLDNYLKTIFDSIKGIVIEDDHQITQVTIVKEENQFVSGFSIAIRLNTLPGETYYEDLDSEYWEEQREWKVSQGGLCCIEAY